MEETEAFKPLLTSLGELQIIWETTERFLEVEAINFVHLFLHLFVPRLVYSVLERCTSDASILFWDDVQLLLNARLSIRNETPIQDIQLQNLRR